MRKTSKNDAERVWKRSRYKRGRNMVRGDLRVRAQCKEWKEKGEYECATR